MNRRALFSFFAAAPVVAAAGIAKACQPTPDKIEVGKFAIEAKGDTLTIGSEDFVVIQVTGLPTYLGEWA